MLMPFLCVRVRVHVRLELRTSRHVWYPAVFSVTHLMDKQDSESHWLCVDNNTRVHILSLG